MNIKSKDAGDFGSQGQNEKKGRESTSGCHENDIRTADSRPFIQHKRLMFHLPYCHRIARKVCSTAKVVRGIGDQFLCRAASGIEICVETVFIRVDRYIDALMFTLRSKMHWRFVRSTERKEP